MITVLWILLALLAIVFLLAGLTKVFQSKEKLAERMPWVEGYSQGQIKLIGILEILGSLGLILPGLTGIMPWLTSFAAIGLALLMVGAIVTHFRRGETPYVIFNIVLIALAVFVAYGSIIALPL